jgi:hypothetical protein
MWDITTFYFLKQLHITQYDKEKYLSDLRLGKIFYDCRISAARILCQKDALLATKEDAGFYNFQTF